MLAGWAAQIAFAARCCAVLAGQVVHQVGAAAAMLAGAQVNVVQHLLEPFLEASVAGGKPLLDSVQVRTFRQFRPSYERHSTAVGPVEQQIALGQAHEQRIDAAWIQPGLPVDGSCPVWCLPVPSSADGVKEGSCQVTLVRICDAR